MKEHASFQHEIISKDTCMVKKYTLLALLKQIINENLLESLYIEGRFFKPWPLGSGQGHNRGLKFYTCIHIENLFKKSSQKPQEYIMSY